MEALSEILPIILYILLIILVVVLIILGIRLIKTLTKVDKVVDDVNDKVNKLNGFFNIIDTTTDALSMLSDKVVSGISNFITKIFKKKNRKKEDKVNE